MGELYNGFLSEDNNGKSAVTWKEREWNRYIKESDAEVGKFYNLLIKYKNISNHLDFVFAKMSWITLSNKQHRQVDEEEDEIFFYGEENISIHKSPIFIATRGLMFFLEKVSDIFIANTDKIDAKLFWSFSKTFGSIKENMFVGIYLIDVGELWPAICHLKTVMDFCNLALSLLQEIHSESKCSSKFIEDFRVGIFDIRELAWQSMLFCREEIKNGFEK